MYYRDPDHNQHATVKQQQARLVACLDTPMDEDSGPIEELLDDLQHPELDALWQRIKRQMFGAHHDEPRVMCDRLLSEMTLFTRALQDMHDAMVAEEIRIEHQGATWVGTYHVTGETITARFGARSSRARLRGRDPESVAIDMLFDLLDAYLAGSDDTHHAAFAAG